MGKHSQISKKKFHKKKTSAKKKNKFIFILLEIISICLIIYSGYNIYIWCCDSSKSEEEINDISNSIDVQEIPDTKATTIIKSKEDKKNPYWDYIKMKLINVDFSELNKTNSDVVRLDTSKWHKY